MLHKPAIGKHSVRIFLILGCFFVFGSGFTPSNFPEKVIGILRSGGYGICPKYEARFFENGLVAYTGLEDVDQIGRFEAFLSRNELNALLNEAWQNGLFDMPDRFPPEGPHLEDLPSTTIYLKLGPRKKVIRYNYLAPKAFHAFVEKLEKALEEIDWRKIPD